MYEPPYLNVFINEISYVSYDYSIIIAILIAAAVGIDLGSDLLDRKKVLFFGPASEIIRSLGGPGAKNT